MDIPMIKPSFYQPLYLEKKGNPYKWTYMRPNVGSLVVPRIIPEGNLFLFTRNGEYYDILLINADTTLFKFDALPFTHWFTKPISPHSRFCNHDKPIIMDDGVEYLVDIHGRLKFVSTETLLQDALPISTWYDDKDLFPIR